MRVLEICPDFPPVVRGGTETFRLLAEYWKKSGNDVTVVFSTPSGKEPSEADVESLPFDLEIFSLITAPRSLAEATYHFPLRLKEFFRLIKLLRMKAKISDVIVIQGLMQTVPLISVFLLKKYRAKIILTEHGISSAEYSVFLRTASVLLYKTIGKIAISNLNRILVFSRRTQDEMIRYYGGSIVEKLTLTTLGIDVNSLEESIKSLENSHSIFAEWFDKLEIGDSGYIFAIGRNVKTKGFDILIRAFAQVLKVHSPLKLLIAGDRTEHSLELANLAIELGISDHTKLLGRLSNEQKLFLMQHAKCFVIPSRKEGYGLNAVEAAILNIPTVATRTGAHEDILAGQRIALLVNTNDVTGLADAILQLLTSNARKSGIDQETKEKFDIKKLADDYLQMLRKER